MAQIHIAVPQQGKVVVHCDITSVIEGEYITWVVDNQNPEVRKVTIEFDKDPYAPFFPTTDDPTRFEKDLDRGWVIWGRAPQKTDVPGRTKYTYKVKAGDILGLAEVSTDPKIFTDKP